MFGFRDPRGAEVQSGRGWLQLATLGPAGQERMGGQEEAPTCRGSPRANQAPAKGPHESQPQRPPRPCCPGPDLPPSACPQDIWSSAAGQHPSAWPGPPPLYLGTRQRQVMPEAAAGALGPEQPDRRDPAAALAQGSAGSPVGPGSEGSPGWSSPLSPVRPTPVRLQGRLWGGDPLLRTGV